MSRKRHYLANGFALAEALAASAILAVAALSVAVALTSSQGQMQDAQQGHQATRLAEEMIETVLGRPYAGIQGYSEPAGAIKDPAGNLYPAEYQVFTRSLTAVNTTTNVAALGGTINGLMVTATVTNSSGRQWTLTRFIAQPPS